MDYSSLARMASAMGYTEFTQLQEEAFQNPEILRPDQNILVMGPTSSGKTLIPMLMYYQRVQEADRERKRRPKMLFVVPYKALASQKCTELVAPYQEVYGADSPLRAVQSTGEYRYADRAIQQADVDVAVIISEKAFLFSCENHAFLSQFDEVVFDEIGLLADESRGVKLDFLLVWCRMMQRQYGRPRMTLLATPFYNWSAYVEKFDLALVEASGRPCLLERPVFVSGSKEKNVAYTSEGDTDTPLPPMIHICREGQKEVTRCPAVAAGEDGPYLCQVDQLCRRDQDVPCEKIGGPCQYPVAAIQKGMPYKAYVIAQICRWHLQHDRQVLIFWNNREEVRQLALRLYSLLKDILPPVPPLEQCKKQVLDGCSRQVKSFDGSSLRSTEMTEDELFGILEEDHYRALCSGIGFHSSAVPNELRCYIEEQFLKTGNLKIVCSTETLAYGVNSAVDAVVIADMTKMKGRRQSLLSANEYQNYVGRAGRLRPGLSMEDIVGWVHPIINGHSPEDKRFTNDEGMYTHWMQIRAPKTVDIMYSRVFDPDNQNLPFLLLCLLPDTSEEAITQHELQEWLEQLPRVPGQAILLGGALHFLLAENLIRVRSQGRRTATRQATDRYYVADKGHQLRGYIPSIGDYRCVLRALHQSLAAHPWEEAPAFREAVFVYCLLDAPCLHNAQEMLDIDRLEAKKRRPENADVPEPADELPGEGLSREKLENLLSGLAVRDAMQPLLEIVDLDQKAVRKKCLLTAATLCWADSMNPRKLYNTFLIAYPLIQSLTQEMSFLMDIAGRLIDEIPRASGELEMDYSLRQAVVSKAIQMLSRSIYFGIQRDLYEKMLRFFQEKPGEDSQRIYASLANPQPSMARQLRRITEYRSLLSGPHSSDRALVRKRMAARKELKNLGRLWPEFIQSVNSADTAGSGNHVSDKE